VKPGKRLQLLYRSIFRFQDISLLKLRHCAFWWLVASVWQGYTGSIFRVEVNINSYVTMGVCILLRVYQIKLLDRPSFATSIVCFFYFMHPFMFTTCFGPDHKGQLQVILYNKIFFKKVTILFQRIRWVNITII
jgi:hypothetical protein